MPQEIPPVKADSDDNDREPVHTVQQTGDALAGCPAGRTPDMQGAPLQMHDGSQGSRSETQNHHKDIQSCTRKCKGRPSSLGPSSRTIWQ